MQKTNQKEKYNLYIEILTKWQSAVNLIAPSTINGIYNRHMVDGIILADYIKKHFSEDIKITDIGSGAGFPGMILAIEGFNNISLVESDVKKTSFLNNIKLAYNLNNLNILNDRVEKITDSSDIITSRAFKSVKETIELSLNMINNKTELILLKGKNVLIEIKEAQKHFQFYYELIKNTNPTSDGYILHIKNIVKI
jgi:16S rRNA (guanine527-N7)-methyltransferase